MITNPPRPCERQCKGPCGLWKHYSRFRSWKHRRGGRYSTESAPVQFSIVCKDCEQKERNKEKNTDRPKAIIEQRARSAATKAGESFYFFWTQMNYRSLVPVLRAMMTPEGLCQGCGHNFLNERDIQIEHLEAPRDQTDWARLHTRNLRLFCASCNGSKARKPFSQWLDDEEIRRLSNLAVPNGEPTHEQVQEHQFSMFDGLLRISP